MVYKTIHIWSGHAVDQRNINVSLRGSPYVDRYRLEEASIPLSFPAVNEANRNVAFSVGGQRYNVTLPIGDYTIDSFPGTLTSALESGVPNTWNVRYDLVKRCFIVSGASAFTILPYSEGTTAWRVIGAEKYGSGLSGTTVELGSPDLSNSSPILICSQNLSSKDCLLASEENINLLAAVSPASSPSNSWLTWQSNSGWLTLGAEVPSIDITLLDGSSLRKLNMDQPFHLVIGLLTSADDVAP